MIWAIVLASTIPFIENEILRSNFGYLFAIGIYSAVFAYFILETKSARKLINRSVRNFKASPHLILYLIFMFSSLIIINFFYNDEITPNRIIRMAGYILITVLSYILIPELMWPKRLKQYWMALMVVGAFSAMLGILNLFAKLQSFLGLKLVSYLNSPIFNIPSTAGPFYEINAYSSVLALGIVGSFYFITRRKKLLLAWSSLLICSFAIFFTWSRAMYLAVPAAIWTSVVIGANAKKRFWIILCTGVSFGLGILIIFKVPLFSTLFQLDAGLSGRDILWKAAFSAISDRPFSGYGMGLDKILDVMQQYGGIFHSKAMSTHNGFLEIGMQTGALTMLAFLSVFLVSIIRLMRSNIDIFEKRVIASGIVVTFISTSFLPQCLGGASYMSLNLGILWGLGNIANIETFEGKNYRMRDDSLNK